MKFHYSRPDEIKSIEENEAYVLGNRIIKIFTNYFFDINSPRAMCKFEYNSKEWRTKIIENVKDSHVSCYHPPAYLIDPSLEANGGITKLSISSNGIDFSDEVNFKYIKNVEITDVFP